MSNYDMKSAMYSDFVSKKIWDNEGAKACRLQMGITSENVAEKFGVSRETQDKFALASHAKAVAAHKRGAFAKEITPYTTTVKDKEGKESQIVVDKDDGMREGMKMENLSKLKPIFKEGGSTTAGNASQMTDGASCIMLTRRDIANKLGAKIFGRIVGFAAVGVAPEIMGIGPAAAIPAALKKTGLEMKDIDIFEINEAFASQACYCASNLNVPVEKLNPSGGAIAVGHPLAMTGARMICTLFRELEEENKKTGLVSMCIGTGMGAAAVIESE